jgi:hypothetical protein
MKINIMTKLRVSRQIQKTQSLPPDGFVGNLNVPLCLTEG